MYQVKLFPLNNDGVAYIGIYCPKNREWENELIQIGANWNKSNEFLFLKNTFAGWVCSLKRLLVFSKTSSL